MTPETRWLNRTVKGLPSKSWFMFLPRHVVLPYRVWRPQAKAAGRPRTAAGRKRAKDDEPHHPLKASSAIRRAQATPAIAKNVDEMFDGLDNVGTVHTARFLLLGGHICMISVYDGDFSNYIRDFIETIGSVFDDVITLVEGGDAMIPTAHNIQAFIDWVHAHDLFQAPDVPTDLFVLQDAAAGITDGAPHPLTSLPRALVLQLHANPNISLGGGYRAYPGYSAAQIRYKFRVGW